jgi:branched-chain amino acid transport system ATP-binding protein
MSDLFRVEGLSKSFGGLAVSRNISLSLPAGERLALIGPNGAGKTTFVNLVTGQLKPERGTRHPEWRGCN